MLGRLDPAQRLIPALFGLSAALIGLLAGYDPKMAVAGALGIAFLLVALANITAGLVAFTLIVFLELAPAAGGPALSFTKIAGAVLALSFLARYASKDRFDDVFWTEYPAYTTLLIAFVAWTAASCFWAEDPSVALGSVSRLALNAILFVIVLEAVRTRKATALVLGALIAGAGVAAIYGVVATPDASQFAYSETAGSGLGRLAGTVGDPNELASLLVVGLILALALATMTKDVLLRSVIVGIGVLCALGAFLTASRGGLVALGGGLIAAIVIAPRNRLAVFMMALMVTVGTVGYFAVLAPQGARERLTLGDGGTGRTDIWKIAWRMVEDHPIEGVGVANFQVASIHYLLAKPGAIAEDRFVVDQPAVAHNAYLHILAELGIVGLLMFLGVILAALGCAFKAMRAFGRLKDRGMETLSAGLLVALVSLLAADFFVSEQYGKQLWLMMAMTPALLTLARRGEREHPERAQGASARTAADSRYAISRS